ncbi:MAG: hypothetical protein ACYTGL_16790 [Planctomycetota bacterium]
MRGRQLLVALVVVASAASLSQGNEAAVSREEAYAESGLAKPNTEARGNKPTGLKGRLVTGYQGWFRAEGDGSRLGFQHYRKGRTFEPGNCTIDLWPDLSEFDDDERFPTTFRHQDGSTANTVRHGICA